MLRRTESAAPKFDTEAVAAMRLELEKAFSADNPRGSGPAFRPRVKSGMGTFRIVLVAVALVAGGLAAYLTMMTNDKAAAVPPQAVAQPAPEPRTQILVAKQAIEAGERLSDAVEWVDWPENAIRPEFITVKATPNAISDMAGDVARFEFFPGEPIRMEKIGSAGKGYMSAILDTGMRGVSVSVAAESASGGFIVPNDHVDVVLTHTTGQGPVSETVLHDVKVLAINASLGETAASDNADNAKAEVFSDTAIATLELDPTQAEVIINSVNVGKLTLVLRSVSDFATADPGAHRSANETIRMSSPFWTH